MLLAQSGAFCGYGYSRTLIGSPIPEVKPTGHSGRMQQPEVAERGRFLSKWTSAEENGRLKVQNWTDKE